jgi:hypothetical protein
MRQPRIRSVASRSFVALTVIVFAIGCASVRPIGPGDALRSNEGLLVLQVRTDLLLRSISISGLSIPLDVRRGTELRLIAVSAGSYRWSGLGVPANLDDSRQPGIVDLVFADVAEFRFRIDAGRINYAGMLEVYDAGWGQVGMRSVDRTALAIEELRGQFPAWVAQYPITYSGSARHVFLERYLAAKSAPDQVGESVRDGPR